MTSGNVHEYTTPSGNVRTDFQWVVDLYAYRATCILRASFYIICARNGSFRVSFLSVPRNVTYRIVSYRIVSYRCLPPGFASRDAIWSRDDKVVPKFMFHCCCPIFVASLVFRALRSARNRHVRPPPLSPPIIYGKRSTTSPFSFFAMWSNRRVEGMEEVIPR